MRQPSTAIRRNVIHGHRCDYDPDCITRSAILGYRKLKSSLAEKNPDSRGKSSTRQNSSDSKVSGSKFPIEIPDSKSLETRPNRESLFRIIARPLVCTLKTNPALKRSGLTISSSVNLVWVLPIWVACNSQFCKIQIFVNGSFSIIMKP